MTVRELLIRAIAYSIASLLAFAFMIMSILDWILPWYVYAISFLYIFLVASNLAQHLFEESRLLDFILKSDKRNRDLRQQRRNREMNLCGGRNAASCTTPTTAQPIRGSVVAYVHGDTGSTDQNTRAQSSPTTNTT